MGITTQTDHGLYFNGSQMYVQHNHPDNPVTLLTLHNGTGMDVVGNIKSTNQIRATGWFTGNSSDNPLALEIGISGGRGWVLAYDRVTSTYHPLSLSSNSAKLSLEPTGNVEVEGINFISKSKMSWFGTADWDTVGTTGPSRLLLNAHQRFWIGAGNGTWFTGTANSKTQASGLAADASQAHDLLITTMVSDATHDRGVTFAVTLDDNVNNGYRLGKWHSGDAADSSMLAIDGGLRVKGGYIDEYDYYADDYSGYRSYRAGGSYWTGDSNWSDPSITASTAIQIQSGNAAQNARNPALQFHQYGYGGVQIRYDGPGDILYIESTGTDRFDTTRFKTDHGWIELGPKNTSHAHIYTDRADFYFNKQLSVNGATVWNTGNDGSGSGLDADKVDGIQASSFLRSDAGDSATGSINFTSNYYAFGDRTGSVSNDGTWNARVNVAGWSHARIDTKCVLDGIITTMYAHTGGAAGRIGTMSDHKLEFITGGTVRATLGTTGSLSTTSQGTLWGSSNDGSGSGLDADTVDGLQASSFVRSDANDTVTGLLTLNRDNESLRLRSPTTTSSPYLTFYQGDDRRAYIQFHDATNTLRLFNDVYDEYLSVGNGAGGLKWNNGGTDYTVWHAGNDGSGSGLDADTVDSLQASSFARSDMSDTLTGSTYSFSSTTNEKIVLQGATNPYIRFREGDTDKAYVQWNDGGYMYIRNQEDGSGIRVRDTFDFSYEGTTFYEIWHAGNDGSGSGLDADMLDGLSSGSFLRSDASDTFTGKLSVGSTSLRSAGIYGIYDSAKTGQIWSMGTAYAIPNDGSSFGNLYGLAYKHTNNATGGNMGGSHQMVWCNNGVARGAIGYDYVWHANGMRVGSNTVWHAGNDGSSSGLDSDLLDGQHGSYYRSASNLNAGTISDALLPGSISSDITGNAATATTATNADNADKLDNLDSTAFARVDGVATIDMNNRDINYVNQLHFNDNVRFFDDGNDQFLNFKWADTGAGGIKFLDGNDKLHGYVYGDGSGRLGFLDDDGNWAVKVGIDAEPLTLQCDNNPELYVYNSYVYAPGSFRAPTFYVNGNIYHNGDTDTYIGFHNDNQFRVVTGGSEQMEWGNGYTVMNDSKEFRLGTSSDFRMWFDGNHTYFRNYAHANGNIYFQGEDPSGGNKALLYLYSDTTGDAHIRGYHDSNEVFRTKSSGTLQVGNPSNTSNENGELQLTAYLQTNYSLDIYKDVNNVYGHGSSAMIWRVFQGSGGVISFNAADGSFRSTGDIIAYSSSDVRLKDNIKSIDNAIDKVLTLNGCEFDWNDKQSTHQGSDVGLIAQDVEQVVPQAVRTNDSGYKSVRYEKMIPLLVQSIKEQQSHIDKQQQQIEQLLKRVERLEK